MWRLSTAATRIVEPPVVRSSLLLAALVLSTISTGCHRSKHNLQTKLDAGCATAETCDELLRLAMAQRIRCKPNTIGYPRCSRVDEQIQTAQRLRQELQDRERASRQADEKEQEWLDEQLRLRDVKLAQAKYDYELATTWAELDLEACSVRLDEAECSEIGAFVERFRHSEQGKLGAEALAAADAERKRRAAVAEKEALDARVAEEEAKRLRAAQWAKDHPQPVAPVQERPSGVLCRDGTMSPSCVCGGSLKGCCSSHGGVAGCE